MADEHNSSTSNISILPSCTIFPDNPSHCTHLIAVRRTFAAISLIGCVFIIFVIWLYKKYIAFSQRLILYMTIAGFSISIAYLMGDLHPDGPLCEFQAFWMQLFQWGVLTWISCITFNLFVNVVWQRHTEQYEWMYHIVCWGLSLLMACLPFIGDHYGPAGAWCWVVNNWRWRIGVWYGPQIVTLVILMVVYTYISCVLSNKVSTWQGTYDPDTERNKQMLKEDIKPLRLYPFVYLAISIFPIINRIQNAVDAEHPVFALMILQAIFGPSQGFLNAIVFAMDRETFRRLTPSQIKLALMNKFSERALIHEFPDSPDTSEY
ncbi:cyclic AMP receptor-like protein A isoform X2 [Mya arenaria]|uniref:cyclic AMP receptor-like protein A isoform X2 n=1 Tax=Mya arenaria TaxID=6604 RepID=UPI0022E21230|nr:cyclic AMP receptor-like protein A isoform X2 [Mya arenaria]